MLQISFMKFEILNFEAAPETDNLWAIKWIEIDQIQFVIGLLQPFLQFQVFLDPILLLVFFTPLNPVILTFFQNKFENNASFFLLRHAVF